MGKRVDRYLIFLIISAIATRFFMLTARPVDHDESIHAYLAYVLLKYHQYRYNPAFHGPFLYFSSALMFKIFGDSILVARAIPALFSILGIIAAYKMKRWMGKGAYLFSLIMLISPSILYYSRYDRNDLILVGSFLFVTYCYFMYNETKLERYVYAAVLFFTIMLCSKENAYIYLFIFLTFVLGYGIKERGLDYLRDLLRPDKKKVRMVVISALIFLTLYVPLYTAMFTDWGGLERATIGAIKYWFMITGKRDHWEPIYYYSEIILQYEFLPLFLALISIPEFIKSKRSKFECYAAHWLVLALFAYHLLSHKVPWLTVHIVTPMAMFGCLYIDRLDTRYFRAVLAVLICATVVTSFYVTYIDYNDAVNQMLIYIQVQPPAVKLAHKIIELYKKGYSVVVYEPTNDYWPLPWYLRHYPIPFMNKGNVSGFDYIVTSERAAKSIKVGKIIGRYEIRPYYYMVLIENKHLLSKSS